MPVRVTGVFTQTLGIGDGVIVGAGGGLTIVTGIVIESTRSVQYFRFKIILNDDKVELLTNILVLFFVLSPITVAAYAESMSHSYNTSGL